MSDSKPEGEGRDKPKIVVDEDWKAQAEAEKQRLAQEEKAAPAPAGAGRAKELPRASFATLVSSQVTQILFALGALADAQGRRYRNLDIAKHHIDTLAVIEEKTKGNLTEDEKKLLDNALYEVRMAYVQAAQGPAGGGGGTR